jgi:hypothetical protein
MARLRDAEAAAGWRGGLHWAALVTTIHVHGPGIVTPGVGEWRHVSADDLDGATAEADEVTRRLHERRARRLRANGESKG